MESHVPGKLDTKMAKAANPLYGDQISAAQAGVAKSVESGDTRAQQRGGLCGIELIRHGRDCARFSDHHFRVSTVNGHSGHHWVLTIHDVSASARFARAVFAGDQADTNPLTDLPSRHPAAQGVDAANYFMPRNARQSQTRVDSHHRGRIGVTDSACFHPNANLACSGLGDWPFHYAKNAGS
jgi:hypothetical protein